MEATPIQTGNGDRQRLTTFIRCVFDKLLLHNANKNLSLLASSTNAQKELLTHLRLCPRLNGLTPDMLLKRIEKYMDCSCSVYVVAMVYLDRLSSCTGIFLDPYIFPHLFFGCIVLARKMLEDNALDVTFVAKVGGYLPNPVGTRSGLEVFKKLEVILCKSLNWDLVVKDVDFWNYFSQLSTGAGVSVGVL